MASPAWCSQDNWISYIPLSSLTESNPRGEGGNRKLLKPDLGSTNMPLLSHTIRQACHQASPQTKKGELDPTSQRKEKGRIYSHLSPTGAATVYLDLKSIFFL